MIPLKWLLAIQFILELAILAMVLRMNLMVHE